MITKITTNTKEEGLSQKDTIAVDSAGTPDTKIWLTIKEASDLLGYSERHMWRIVQQKRWQTIKMLNFFRKKTYLLRADVEKFYKAECEKQETPALNDVSVAGPVVSDKNSEIDKLDKEPALSAMAENKIAAVLVAVMTEYKQSLVTSHMKYSKLIKKAAFWKTSALWLIFVTVCGFLFFGLWVLNANNALSDSRSDFVNSREALISKETELFLLTNQAGDMSDKLKIATEELQEKTIWIRMLETHFSQRQLVRLKYQNTLAR